jgi:hypothetical protein
MDLLDSDRTGGASINRAGVVTNREELALIVEHRSILLNQAVDKRLSWLVKMRKVELRAEPRTVLGFIVNRKESGVNIVQSRGRVFAFTKNATTVNAMEDDIEVVGLVGEAAIVIEYVRAFQAAATCSNADRLQRRRKSRWAIATIIRRRSSDTPEITETEH